MMWQAKEGIVRSPSPLGSVEAESRLQPSRTFIRSEELRSRFLSTIPGGAHTYAKADDQFPEHAAPYIVRGKGCHVWDVDGNEYIEYGMGVRSVALGHAYEPVLAAVRRQLEMGSNFVRPATIELECAETLCQMIPGAEMVKFGKNGSDATTAAVRLSRAYTGRDMVAICADHPFFSVDDWFMGTTAMCAGIPKAIQDLTVKFHYNDLDSARELFAEYPDRIACLIMEVEKDKTPAPNFLHDLKELCHKNGALFVLDEIITGFRWHNGGGQAYYGITADLSTFGKAMGNGFSVSALIGRRDIMRLGGFDHDRERVFLLSLTHGAETHNLAAALATMHVYQREPVIETLWRQGERLARGIQQSISEHHLDGYFTLSGRPCSMVYGTRDNNRQPSQPFRTLFLQETIKRGLLAGSLVISYSHSDEDIDRTVEIIHAALGVYRNAIEQGIERYLIGRSVKPTIRRFS